MIGFTHRPTHILQLLDYVLAHTLTLLSVILPHVGDFAQDRLEPISGEVGPSKERLQVGSHDYSLQLNVDHMKVIHDSQIDIGQPPPPDVACISAW
jgi:hypothetical protein